MQTTNDLIIILGLTAFAFTVLGLGLFGYFTVTHK